LGAGQAPAAEAREWIIEAGDAVVFWCLLAGIEPSRARRMRLAVETEGRRSMLRQAHV
jgi:hypothetical protein